MNKIIFTEEFCQPENLRPFTLTRQIQDIRIGILTIREKWEKMLGFPSFDRKEDDYKDLDRSVSLEEAAADSVCFMIHGNVLPEKGLIKIIRKLKNGEFISVNNNAGIIFRFTRNEIKEKYKTKVTRAVAYKADIKTIRFPWEIFLLNDWAIRQDFDLLTKKRVSQPIPKSNKVSKPSRIFIEKGAKLEH